MSGYIGAIPGIMEKKMETTGIKELYRGYRGIMHLCCSSNAELMCVRCATLNASSKRQMT